MKHFKAPLAALLLILALAATGFASQKKFPFTASEDVDGARFVWFVFKESGTPFPYFSTKNFRQLERFRQLTVEAPASGDVMWWPDYVALYSKDKKGDEASMAALGKTPLPLVVEKRGKPLYLRYVPLPAPKKRPPEKDLKNFSLTLGKLSKVADSYPPKTTGKEELQKVKAAYREGEKLPNALLEGYADDGVVRLMAGRFYRFGHNLELGSWNKSRDNLTKAISLMPDNPFPYLELGLLLVNASTDYADNAEYLFSEAMRLSDESDVAATGLRGLVLARYHKGDIEGALSTADNFLKKWPGDQAMAELKKTIGANPIRKTGTQKSSGAEGK